MSSFNKDETRQVNSGTDVQGIEPLVENVKTSHSERNQKAILEQYKLYVEMMDRSSSRRIQMNSFYTTLLSGLLAFITVATNKDIIQFQNTKFQAASLVAIASLGIFLCFSWYMNIQSYKQLNSSKFKVINELEQQLPFACFTKEWEVLKRDSRYKGYLTQTYVEKLLPAVLAIPYIGLFIYSLSYFGN